MGSSGLIQSHRDLVAWQKAMDLVVHIYACSDLFPTREQYRLTGQVTRSAVSVPANIAEGYSPSAPADYARFLAIAKGSLMETETLVITELEKILTILRKRVLESA